MDIAIIGTGYVGLVSGTCFAEMGHHVICVDKDENKINGLRGGKIPIYEPGLEELVKRNVREERLKFTTDLQDAVNRSLFIFSAVGTPSDTDGSADLQFVLQVANEVAAVMNDYKIFINKSTVPVGTAEKVRAVIADKLKDRGSKLEFDMVSNPEFLKEGDAVRDFLKPDRVVIGTDNVRTTQLMKELYSPFVRTGSPVIIMDIPSAELTKYASNAMLATRISFMNEIANLCDVIGADVAQVRRGMGTDSRIGSKFLFPGIGFGGSCFPKDIRALYHTGKNNGIGMKVLEAVEEVNDHQKKQLFRKMMAHYKNDIKGKTFAMWGLSFKPNTDDMREAPSTVMIDLLLEQGACVNAYDPEALEEAKKIRPENDCLHYFETAHKAVEGAEALILVTEWAPFRNMDEAYLKEHLKEPVIFDGRNIYEPKDMIASGFNYYTIGRDHAHKSNHGS